jgi:hypothetical protein
MGATLLAAFGVTAAALVTAAATIVLSLHQGRRSLERERRVHAFERHLSQYEKIFVAARSTQDALSDFRAIERRVSDRSDPFLRQLLAILANSSYQYCVAVDWRHNPGMAYLGIKLEKQCLRTRNLLIQWLSRQRITSGDIAFLRNEGVVSSVPIRHIRTLRVGDYQELRVEKRTIVTLDPEDLKLISRIDLALSSVIVELKAVMAQ